MRKQQFCGLLVLLLVTAAVVGGDWHRQRKAEQEAEAYEALLADLPVAELDGEAVSPNGRFKIRTVGKSDTYVSGLRLPERLEVVDAGTGAVLWEDMGYLRQSALWSPDSAYLALAYGGRTWEQVKIIETETWTAWDMTLPDGGPIPEYTFLPEDWGAWQEKYVPEKDHDLILTVGRGGDAGEQHTYRCWFRMEDDALTGSTMEQTTETLPGDWDFDHDGAAETVEIVTVWSRPPMEEGQTRASWYELHILRQDGTALWVRDDLALAHVGWGSIFARTMLARMNNG